MKLVCLILAFSLIALADCRNTPGWFPTNIIDTVSNKTSQITNYVREKGRSITRFYSDNIRHKLSSYFSYKHDDDIKNYEDVTLRQETTNRKFNEYIADAKDNGKEVFDVIAPKTPKYECHDDNPEVHMTTPQLIASHEYPAESHTVLTEDGYLLTLHRIPHGKNSSVLKPRKTVLLHHGLLGSSADWVLTGPKKGLAYILADAGYDVWLANARGNTYSRAHIYKKLDSFAFWNFTFHEIAQYDLPATIDYIMDQKGWEVKMNYVGHSMGTTALFALLSTKPQYNKILRAGFALAPVAYMTKVRSPIHLLAKYANNIEYLLKLLGANEFLPQNAVLRWLSKHACEINHYEEAICENSLFVLCGHDEKQFNRTLLPIILGHMPAGASTKTLVHYAQEIRNSGKFQQFDFGPEGNLREYQAMVPPEYPLQKITLPTALLSAENDWLASEKDVTDLYLQLANPIEHFIVPDKEFNHIDFLLAIDAPNLVYKKLLQLMDEGSTSMYDSMEDMNAIPT